MVKTENQVEGGTYRFQRAFCDLSLIDLFDSNVSQIPPDT
jgi:hypothetical protein